ncbi:MAG: Gfo/Idh/MocA family oxidoreductase [Acidimicrobiales bacterium]|nr:Gfo/Idh/MocA family oxidoreductase [Acidimicrobiales bacterium]
MEPLRIGLIGAGGMGSFHARTLATMPGVTVSVVADPVGDAAESLAAELDAVGMMDPMMLATAGGVDGLVIASPDETHAELALAAIELGTPVLCEKPLATTMSDCRRVIEAEATVGSRLLQLGFMREYDLAHRQLQESIAQLGRIHSLRCVHLNTYADQRTDAAIVNQSAVHDFHTIRFLSGADIVAVTAHVTRQESGGIRHLIVLCTLSSGAHATVEFDDHGFAYDVTVEVTAEKGSVLTGPQVRAIHRWNGQTQVNIGMDWFGRFADAYRLQNEIWVDSLRSGVTVGPSAWDGLAATAVVNAVFDSLEKGGSSSVSLPDRPSIYA